MNQVLLNVIDPSELLNSIRKIVQEVVTTCQQTPRDRPANRIGGIELAREVTGFASSTIYNLVAQNNIPHCKQGRKLYFFEEELLEWIRSGRRKTISDISSNVDNFLGRHRKGKAKNI
jgi:predicted DNA-binding transcriptional regulator AlpA